MHRRYDKANVPIELLRTLVVIANERSFTRTGEILGLTQSAISAQVKRLQQLIGGEVFDRSGPGHFLNQRGKTLERYARRILDLNDQLLAFPGARSSPKMLRIGLPNYFVESKLVAMLAACAAVAPDCAIQTQSGTGDELQNALSGGFLDIAMVVFPSERVSQLLCEWHEDLGWVSGRDLVLRPGEPLPLISWPGSGIERMVLRTLGQANMPYQVIFAGSDLGSRMVAVRAGLGVMVVPKRVIPEGLKSLTTLPRLASMRVAICVNDTMDLEEARAICKAVEIAVRPEAEASRGNGMPPQTEPSRVALHYVT